MPISLSKGGNLSLTKQAPGLTKILLGLGWDARATDGSQFDLDASAFLLDANEKVRSDSDFIFYNQTKSGCGSVQHLGDNRTGAGEGDDEQLTIDLNAVPTDVSKVAFTVTIDQAEDRKQNFGMVKNAFIRVVNAADNNELARYDLSEDASLETAMIFAEVYRSGSEWKFKAIGQGYAGGLAAVSKGFGVNV